MAKKKQIQDFDALKNPDMKYHYSRAERLKQRNHPLYKKAVSKGLARFFGGNKMVANMVVFYIVLGLFVFAYFTLFEQSESLEYKQIFTAARGQSFQVRLITNTQKYGLNITLQNKSKTNWNLEGFILTLPAYTNNTNFLLTLTPGEFDALFLRLPNNISNLIGLDLILKGNTNG